MEFNSKMNTLLLARAQGQIVYSTGLVRRQKALGAAMEVEDEFHGISPNIHVMMFSSAPHWLEYVQPEDLAVCQCVCSSLCKVLTTVSR